MWNLDHLNLEQEEDSHERRKGEISERAYLHVYGPVERLKLPKAGNYEYNDRKEQNPLRD